MEYVIGIDAGATKTHIRIANMEGQLISSGNIGPGNINIIDSHIFGNALCQEIGSLLEKEGLDKENCRSICLGAAGCGNIKNKERYMEILLNTGLSGVKIAETDAVIGLVGALEDDCGIILISGTGSICYGINRAGLHFRSGGWGHIIGDHGGGYYIGAMVLKSIMEAYDKDKPSYLKELVFDYLKISSHEALIEYIYHPSTGKREIASFAKFCNQAFDQGDKIAKEIMYNSGMELSSLLRTVYKRAFQGKEECKWSYAGSIMEKSSFVRQTICHELIDEYPNLRMIEPKNDPSYGAMLIALKNVKK